MILSIPGYSNVQTALDTLNSGNKTISCGVHAVGTLRAGNGTVAAPSISFTANKFGYVF
jgi:hypothetical protein